MAAPYWVTNQPEWAFPTSIGSMPDPRNIRRQVAEVAPDGWPGALHGLRHWHATVSLMESGLGTATVSKALGHSSARITEDTYGHLLEEASTVIASTISTALR